MAEFSFTANQKVIGWQTTSFDVTAETREQAEEKVKELLRNGSRIETDDEDIYVTDDNFSYEDTTLLRIHENMGSPTLIITDDDEKELFNNINIPDKTLKTDTLDIRLAEVIDKNMLNPFFLIGGFNLSCEMIKQMSDEELEKHYCNLYAAGSIRKMSSDIYEMLNKK